MQLMSDGRFVMLKQQVNVFAVNLVFVLELDILRTHKFVDYFQLYLVNTAIDGPIQVQDIAQILEGHEENWRVIFAVNT